MTWREAIERENPSHLFALFSGGHDSLCATHVASQHPRFTAAVHINTGIGIEETREFVRQTCKAQGWPLIEMHPDAETYPELVMEHGFPGGPKGHNRYYYWLKQRQVRRLVREHKQGPDDRIGLVTGIRLSESERRMGAGISTPVRRQGAQLWLNPILYWRGREKNSYMEKHDLPRNQVVDLLHKSGECLCGAFARKGEFNEIELWYPEAAKQITKLEAEAKAAGLKDCYWGRRGIRENPDQLNFLPLCTDCEVAA